METLPCSHWFLYFIPVVPLCKCKKLETKTNRIMKGLNENTKIGSVTFFKISFNKESNNYMIYSDYEMLVQCFAVETKGKAKKLADHYNERCNKEVKERELNVRGLEIKRNVMQSFEKPVTYEYKPS